MKKLKVGIIGLGHWGECHLQAYQTLNQVEVVAICDKDEDRLRMVADKYGIHTRYANESEMLSQDNIDLVSITTHEIEHYSPAVHALQSGKHIIVEQPLATNPAAAVEIWKQAIQNNRYIFVSRLLRRLAPYQAVYQAIKDGKIGKLERIEITRSRSEDLYPMYHRLPTFYENLIPEMDIAFWLSDAIRFDWMETFGSKAMQNGIRNIDRFDFIFDNGVNGCLTNTWTTPTSTHGKTPHQSEQLTSGSLTCFGDQGTITIDTSELYFLLGDPWNRSSLTSPGSEELLDSSFTALREQLQESCDSILNQSDIHYSSIKEANMLVNVADTMLRSIDFKYSVTF
ncbi:Gfo/Idh/MocA family protein [Paenibacillus sp. FA6]|uniref:Gfo/Idh/MocA family protein n=1 Tax=Paenibacillus sp. FA6 TaxID=3413029 RepID=UPI003F659E70